MDKEQTLIPSRKGLSEHCGATMGICVWSPRKIMFLNNLYKFCFEPETENVFKCLS